MTRLEHGLELLIFNSRWLRAPIYVGLVLSMLLLLVKSVQELVHVVGGMFKASEGDVMLAVLTLVDPSLVASIVANSGIELLKALVNIGSDRMGPGLLASRKRTVGADGSRFAFASASATNQRWPALPPRSAPFGHSMATAVIETSSPPAGLAAT